MIGYKIVNLIELLEIQGEDFAKELLATFSCPLNRDVERFLHKNAILFARQGISQTHLVFTSYRNTPVLIGYFTLANKHIHIPTKVLSNTQRKRIAKFAILDINMKAYCMTAPLIAQLGKNFTNSYNKLITGDELLAIACEKVQSIQLNLGGRFTYLECEDTPRLVEFYRRNGFYDFGKRPLDADERTDYKSASLVQLMKYL